MKTLEQLAREAGMADDSGYWLSIFVGKPSEVSLKALARFRAACRAEALEEAAQWQPIETAPKKQLVLLWGERGRQWFIGEWGDYCRVNQPSITHWMPLPQPPAIREMK